MIRKNLLLLSTLLFCTHHLCAEVSIAGKLSLGVSRINYFFDAINSEYTSSFGPSYALGVQASIDLKQNGFSIEMLANRVNGIDEVFLKGLDQQGTPYELTEIYKSCITYLTIPISYAIKWNKVHFEVGMQPSFAIGKFGEQSITGTFEGKPINYQKQIQLNIKNFEVGPRLGCAVNLSDKVWLDFSAYYGIKAIINEPMTQPKIFQSLVGLRYEFI